RVEKFEDERSITESFATAKIEKARTPDQGKSPQAGASDKD
ncbi:hypothetical protein A2U01_0050593, partial [Trifolium medium]|nr:hypothetical protein [Trifolium medium]